MPAVTTPPMPARRAVLHMTAGLGAAVAWPASAQTASRPPLPEPPPGHDLARYASSVVRLDARIVDDGRTVGTLGVRRSGSGVVLDARTVLTIGYLVVEADAVLVTTHAGRSIPGSVLGYDHGTGFGLVRTALPMDAMPLELGDADGIAARTRVLTIGHGEPVATPVLVVSRDSFSGNWEYLCEAPLRTYPPVNNWSGSALIAEDGRLIGIGSLILDERANAAGLPGNLFVPVSLLKPILAELRDTGRTRRAQPWLGMTTEELRGSVVVTRVTAGSPADEAGIAPGDVVVAVGEERVADRAEFYRSVWKRGPAGSVVTLRIAKGGTARIATVRSIDRNDFLRRPTGI